MEGGTRQGQQPVSQLVAGIGLELIGGTTSGNHYKDGFPGILERGERRASLWFVQLVAVGMRQQNETPACPYPANRLLPANPNTKKIYLIN